MRVLQQDGRITNQDLAAKVSLSPSPCLRRLRLLEENKVILGYSAEVDAKAYGLPVLVFVRIRLSPHTQETIQNFERHINRLDEVLECHLMTGPADYLLRVMVAGLHTYEDFIRNRIHTIGGIDSIDSSFVYGSVKRTAVFPGLRS